ANGGLLNKQQTAPGRLTGTRARDTAKISGRLPCGHCLRGDLGAELGELRLDLGRHRREFLGAGAQLVDKLRVELGVLAHELARARRSKRGVYAGETRLQHIAGDGILQPCEALEGPEAFL